LIVKELWGDIHRMLCIKTGEGGLDVSHELRAGAFECSGGRPGISRKRRGAFSQQEAGSRGVQVHLALARITKALMVLLEAMAFIA
jgi:hypothetical protein